MSTADAGLQNGYKAVVSGAGIAIDDVGRIRWEGPPNGVPPAAIAERACLEIGPLLMTEISPVTAQCLGAEGSLLGMVMLRVEGEDGTRFRSGTARGPSEAVAVVDAVVAALGAEDGVLKGTLDRWASRSDAEAVTVLLGDDVVASSGDPDAAVAHHRLSSSLPAPGRLAVGTEDREFRVLRLPDAAIAVSATPGAAVFADIDDWMGVVEAHVSASNGHGG
jgi:hypothetical protein